MFLALDLTSATVKVTLTSVALKTYSPQYYPGRTQEEYHRLVFVNVTLVKIPGCYKCQSEGTYEGYHLDMQAQEQ